MACVKAMETNEKESEFLDDDSVGESIVSNFITTLLNEMDDIDPSDPSTRSDLKPNNARPREEIKSIFETADHDAAFQPYCVQPRKQSATIPSPSQPVMSARSGHDALFRLGSVELVSSDEQSEQSDDSLSTALLIDPVCTASEIVNTPHSPIRIIPHPADPMSPTITTHPPTEEYTQPKLRLDVLMAENDELLAEVTNPNENSSKVKARRRSTFSSNAKSNRGDYQYYKHYFNRLSTADSPYIQHHPTNYAYSSPKKLNRHRHPSDRDEDTNDNASTNPIKLHRQWSRSLRSPDHSNSTSYYTDRRREDCGERNSIFHRLYSDAEHLRIKKEQLRQQYLRDEMDREMESLREAQRYRQHTLQDTHQHFEYDHDPDSVFNKLYNDSFHRQKRLEHQQRLVESEWNRNHSFHNQHHHRGEHLQDYHTEIDQEAVENRLLQWSEYKERKLQRKRELQLNSLCTFQPQLQPVIDRQTQSLRMRSKERSKSIHQYLYEQDKEIKEKRKRLANETWEKETFNPNIKVSQRTVPAPSNMERLLRYIVC